MKHVVRTTVKISRDITQIKTQQGICVSI